MLRRIIEINEDKCNGCGLCAAACHEGAIGMVNGKAKLLRDDYCDGLGDCLPTCPTGAIRFVEREAAAYDEKAVLENQKKKMQNGASHSAPHGGCPGSRMQTLKRNNAASDASSSGSAFTASPGVSSSESAFMARPVVSQLAQWPCQIKLVPVNAPYFQDAKLLIAADCTAYAYANVHEEFMKGHVTLIGCPKLDDVDYSEKLTAIIRDNAIKEVTILRMEVPCCGGLEQAAKTALQNSGKFIPWQVVTISIDGKILA